MRPRFLIALLLVASCTPSESAATPTAGATTDPPSTTIVDNASVTTLAPGEGANVIEEFSFDDAEAVYLLVDHRSDPEVVAAAEGALAAGASGDQLWAATYVWSNEGTDPEPLVALLADQESAIRYMAATGLIARGRIEGFSPLIAALTDESVLAGFEPAGPVWAAATTALVRFTAISAHGPPWDADTARLQLAQDRWQTWLQANQSQLFFDAVDLIWSTR
jgi:hypothetical protein